MQLRTRITLLVAAGFLLLLGTFMAVLILRDRMEEGRVANLVIAGQSALWREIIAVQTASLDQTLGNIAASDAFRAALPGGDRTAILAALGGVDSDLADVDTLFEAVGADREVLFSQGATPGRTLLDAGTIDRVLAGASVTGLRQSSANQIVVIAAHVVSLPSGQKAVIVLARDAASAVSRFAAIVDGGAVLLTLRGNIAAATDRQLWQGTGLTLSPRQPTREQASVDGRTYAVTSVPVSDVSGGTVGALVSMSDTTATASTAQAIRQFALAGAVALALIGIVGLNVFLWYSFRPLEGAIDVLQALSRGDTSVTLESTGKDEIGRIAQAVGAFRANVQALAETRRQRERVRRRQEVMISGELQALADAIDPTDREEVLALLASDPDREEDELRRVARVLHDLSRRIIEQHTRLSAMVVELREALITKTKLAGLQQELEIARQVQLAILPKAFPPNPSVAIHGQMTPAREVGGDFYDYFLIDESTLGFVVADVSGKGVPAALFMAISRTLLRSTALFERSPAGCVRRLNDLLAVENEQMLFVTIFYGVIDLESGKVSYVNAGHNPPYKITQAGAVSTVPSTSGMAVAVMEGFVYQQGELYLSPGDTLFLFTDGVTEAFDIDETPYGDQRLADLLASGAAKGSVEHLSEQVLGSVHAFERGAPQADDITCLTLRYFGGTPRRHAL